MYGLGLAKGLVVTAKNLLLPSRLMTIQYPDRKVGLLGLSESTGMPVISLILKDPLSCVKAILGLMVVKASVPQHPSFRGEEFVWYEQRCTGCASCAKYCPLGIIEIVTSESGDQVQEGQKYNLDKFDIDIGRCMFCGLCVEACPYDALHMGSGFEEGQYSRKDLVITKRQLLGAKKKPSTWFRPQLSSKNYDPHTDKNIKWDSAGRHEKPSLQEQQDNWVKR